MNRNDRVDTQDRSQETTIYNFAVTGHFDIEAGLEPLEAFDGTIIGFRHPDGREVKLVVGLEVRDEIDGRETFIYVTRDSEMEAEGFHGLDYDRLTFEVIPDTGE